MSRTKIFPNSQKKFNFLVRSCFHPLRAKPVTKLDFSPLYKQASLLDTLNEPNKQLSSTKKVKMCKTAFSLKLARFLCFLSFGYRQEPQISEHRESSCVLFD
jgi:hypothetical protein